MVKITASTEKLWKRLEELGEDTLTLSFDEQKSSIEGRRIKNELLKRTRTVSKMQGRCRVAYYKKHPCIDED